MTSCRLTISITSKVSPRQCYDSFTTEDTDDVWVYIIPHFHITVEVGRALWRSLFLSPQLKQGHQEQATQNHVQVIFISNISELQFQCSVTLTVSQCSDRTCCVPVRTHCLLTCLEMPLKRAWLHPLHTLRSDTRTHKWEHAESAL